MERLHSERLYLREIVEDDVHAIVAWKDDPVTRKNSVGIKTIINEENQLEDIQYAINDAYQEYMIICKQSDDDPIGYIRVNWMDDELRFAWLRFGLGKERGNGYSAEAIKLLVDHCFNRGCHRFDAEVFDYNKASLRVLATVGFTLEGRKKEAHYDEGEYSDILVMGLVNNK